MVNRLEQHALNAKFTDLTKCGLWNAFISGTVFINITKSDKKHCIYMLFHRIPILHLTVQKQ